MLRILKCCGAFTEIITLLNRLSMETNSTNNLTLLRIGGYCGVCFAVIWTFCATGYLIVVGIPSSPPSLIETADIMNRPAYGILFWLWPIAYLAVVPFALAVRQYLLVSAPTISRIGTAFLLLYAGLWFVFNASHMAAIELAREELLSETVFGALLTFVGTLGSPLFWAITIFMGCWAIELLNRRGLDRISGFAFALGSFTSLVYFVMRYTGPYQLAEIVHEFLILFMIIGVGSLGVSLIRQGRNPNK